MDPSDPLHEDNSRGRHVDTLAELHNPLTQAPQVSIERPRPEAALHESEERFRIMADALPVIVWVHNAEGQQQFVNRSFLDFFNLSPDETKGDRWQKLLHPAEAQHYTDELNACVRERRHFHAEVRMRRGDGQWAWIESWGRPLLSGSGKHLGFVGTSTDITERKRTEAALLENRERFRTLFESIDEGFCIIEMLFDADGKPVDYRFLETNPAFEKHTGLRAVVGKRMRELEPNLEADWFETYGRIATTGRSERFVKETRLFGNRWYELYAFRIGRHGEHQVAVLFSDITRRKRTEASLLQLNATLEQRVAERTCLAEARSRQLQALAVELIETEEHERRKIAELLHDDLQQVLAAARLHLDAVPRELPHAALIKEVERMLSYAITKSRNLSQQLSPAVLYHSGLFPALKWLCRQMSEQFGLQVELVAEAGIQFENMHLKVFIFRAIQELLFNVIKHAGVKQANVTVAGSENQALVTVIDQGHGFDPSVLNAAPDKAGLGLLSLRERISYIGGHMRISSTPGQGSRVDISLPVDLNAPDMLRNAPPSGTGPEAMADQAARAVRRRVLLVDDHKVMRDGLKYLMKGQPDIEVVGEAANGREAVEQARRLRPDVIIMDISMPVMNGIEATRRIKSEMSGIRVIGLSMFEDELAGNTMRSAGADGYVIKTASSHELLKAIYGIGDDQNQALETMSPKPFVGSKIPIAPTL